MQRKWSRSTAAFMTSPGRAPSTASPLRLHPSPIRNLAPSLSHFSGHPPSRYPTHEDGQGSFVPWVGLVQYLVYVRILYNNRQVIRVWAFAGFPCPDDELLYFRYPAVAKKQYIWGCDLSPNSMR